MKENQYPGAKFRLLFFMVRTLWLRGLVGTCFLIAGCANTQTWLLHDPKPLASAWAVVGITLAGPEADQGKMQVCIEEARKQGISVSNSAPQAAQATLFLADSGNYLSYADGRPKLAVGPFFIEAICKLTFAAVLRLGERIRFGVDEPPPTCRLLGPVEGVKQTDFDFRDQTSESAMAPMQLATQRMKGNYIMIDVISPSLTGPRLPMYGRAIVCPEPGPGSPGVKP